MLNAIFQHLLQHMLNVFNLMFHFVCITHVFQNAGYMCVCHGPDMSHVREKSRGIVLDAAQKRLSRPN